ncbi:MAG: FecR domain-containing protein [bacterium]
MNRVAVPIVAVLALFGIVLAFQVWFSEAQPEGEARPGGSSDSSEAVAADSTDSFDDPFVRFSYGSLELVRDGQEVALDTGDVLTQDDRVVVNEDSLAELQYADAALVRINGPAEFTLGRRVRDDGTRVLSVYLRSGGATVRREEDSSGRTVRIHTDSSIVEADATTYLVSREPQTGDTIVSVAEGRVRVLPSAVDPDELSDLTTVEDILSVVEEISAGSMFVDADGEVRIAPEDVETASDVLRDMKRRLEQYGEAEQPSGEELETIRTLIGYARDRIAETRPEISAASPERLERMEELGDRRMLSLDEDAEESPSSGLSMLRVETDPPDAEVLLDGLPVGSEIFSSLFEPGETVTLSVRKRGYETEEVEVTFEQGGNESISVELDRLQPTIGDAELADAVHRGDADTVEEFISTGGDPNERIEREYTPLAVAFGAGRPLNEIIGRFEPEEEVIRVLLDYGADPDTVFGSEDAPESSLIPLSSVILSGLYRDNVNYELVNMLLEAGASPNIVMETGDMSVTPLALPIIIGIERGEVETRLVERLIEAGSDTSRTIVYEGRLLSPLATALALGADHGYDPDEVVALLVDAGARIESRVRIGGTVWTPLGFAEHAGLENSARVLRERGA